MGVKRARALAEQLLRLAHWEAVACCRRRDAAGAGPILLSEDYTSAKHMLKLGKTPRRDDIPAELLGSSGLVADPTDHKLSVKRFAGTDRYTGLMGGFSSSAHVAIPKPRASSTLPIDGRVACMAPSSSSMAASSGPRRSGAHARRARHL